LIETPTISGPDADSVDVAKVQTALQAQLVKAGLRVVDAAAPHELTAKLSVTDFHTNLGFSNCQTNQSVSCVDGGTSLLVIAASGGVVDQASATYSMNGLATPLGEFPDQVASSLLDALFKSPRILAYAKAHSQSGGAPTTAVATNAPSTSTPASSSAAAISAPITSYTAGSPQPNAYALVVGIEKYRDLPSPTGARADAQKVAALAKSTLGIPDANIHLRLDDHASKGDIEGELQWLKTNVPPGGRAFFYFAGHGAPDTSSNADTQGTPYLIPYDGDAERIAATGIALSEVTQTLGQTQAKDALAILDSCFSGAGGRSVLPKGARPLVRVRDTTPAAQLALFSASSGVQISGPDAAGDGGLFTKYVLDALGTAAADQNGDGQVSLQELSDWVSPRVARDAKRDGRDQAPSVTMGANAGSPSAFIVAYGVAH
jgi:hypothetical protein